MSIAQEMNLQNGRENMNGSCDMNGQLISKNIIKVT